MTGLFELLGLGASAELLSLSGWGGNLLRGLANSLQIAIGAYGLGLVIGLFGAYGKLYGGKVTRDLLAIYTTVIRAVPELVLILILYYVGSDIINKISEGLGGGRVEINGVAAGIWVLGVVQGAYATEVLRGAIQAVPVGQIEAAKSYGMPGFMIMRRVTIPAMMSFAVPGLANLWLIATKDTALLAVVGFNELTLETRQAASSTRAYFTFFLAAGFLYLMVTLCSGAVFARIEKWARRGQPSLRGGTS
ncbi:MULTISPECIES: ABC transporter permease [unclassified Leisingera]|uniref:ABC transporter permease n=1 Tax=unclassified Leisingera TaxID=2614906 RepID=UPI001010C75D|nr:MULTISPECIES: ABC transporter permease subunit [unclassified Leisingera]MBQ4823633.1 ABC transporter permease subunit [Leisingera sp. HS039]MCF6430924.1 ABC transporter permease subunit [Leisingera sp. MMG026]QAX30694.1 ABC transporter permease subunit [Leisingera sp. NJS204]